MSKNSDNREIRRICILSKAAGIISKGQVVYISIAGALFVILAVWLFLRGRLQEDYVEIIDLSVFFAVVLEALLSAFALWIRRRVRNWAEDPTKLTDDYEALVKKYNQQTDMVTYQNPGKDTVTVFPVILSAWVYDTSLKIVDHPEKEYQLPYEIIQHYDELFSAHSTSSIYNNINIRVEDWKLEDGLFYLHTGRTTYYNSLVTNRSIDYPINEGLSVREILESGPFVRPLKYARLSNHLGFNGFLESKDGKICFVLRKSDVSIGKRTYGDSIGASLKTKYALESYAFTNTGLENGFIKEYEDELKVRENDLERFPEGSRVKILAAYRDLLEGGKPQFLVYAKSILDAKDIEKAFNEAVDNKKQKARDKRAEYKRHGRRMSKKERIELLMQEDGEEIVWIQVSELLKAEIYPDRMICKSGIYPMVPSASASLVMFLEYLQCCEESDETFR